MDRKEFIQSHMIKVKPIIEKEGVEIHYTSQPKSGLYNIIESVDFSSGSSKKGGRFRKIYSKTNEIRFPK